MRRVRSTLAGVAMVAMIGGCNCCGNKPKEKPRQAFDPAEQYPGWAYDAPFYYRPAAERGDIGEKISPRWPGGPAHYYTRDRMIYLPQPSRTPTTSPSMPEMGPRTSWVDLAPRVAVHWTDSGGQEWNRAGYFGLGQTHFTFIAENDGVYGFRFVGPGQPPAKCSPPLPQVVYHVDTVPPHVTVYVEPDRPFYRTNESVTVHWMASDINLADAPVSISVCWKADADGEPEWEAIAQNQPAEGSTTFVIPPAAAGRGFKIRADARDRAGNLGAGFSAPLMVDGLTVARQATVTTNPTVVTTRPLLSTTGLVAATTEPGVPTIARVAASTQPGVAAGHPVVPTTESVVATTQPAVPASQPVAVGSKGTVPGVPATLPMSLVGDAELACFTTSQPAPVARTFPARRRPVKAPRRTRSLPPLLPSLSGSNRLP